MLLQLQVQFVCGSQNQFRQWDTVTGTNKKVTYRKQIALQHSYRSYSASMGSQYSPPIIITKNNSNNSNNKKIVVVVVIVVIVVLVVVVVVVVCHFETLS